MILVDVNLLVYATIANHHQHEKARVWLDENLDAVGRVGLPWESVIGFLRVVTSHRIYPQPVSVGDAWAQVQDWLDRPAAWVPTPGQHHGRVLGELVQATSPAANLIHDAHLAALAIEHGLIVASTDGDFARFPGVRWEDPLSS